MASPGATESYVYAQSVASWGDWIVDGLSWPSVMTDGSDATRLTSKSSLAGSGGFFTVNNIAGMSSGSYVDEVGVWLRPLYGTVRFNFHRISPSEYTANVDQYNFNSAGIWYTAIANGPGGSPWTGVDFSTSNIRIHARPLTASMWLSEMRPVVYWFPPAGGFVCFFGCLGPLVAIGLEHMSGIAREILRRTGTKISPLMYARALREFKEYRHPRYFFIGAAA